MFLKGSTAFRVDILLLFWDFSGGSDVSRYPLLDKLYGVVRVYGILKTGSSLVSQTRNSIPAFLPLVYVGAGIAWPSEV